MKTAFLFPGQGSQFVGMGKELYDTFLEAKEVFQEVDHVLKQPLSKIIFEGDAGQLTLTSNTQPAIMASSMAVIRVLEKQGSLNLLDIVSASAGHSLGEYSALCAAQAFSLSDTAKLLRIRGAAMQDSVPVGKGAMVALLSSDISQAEDISSKASQFGICNIANDNGAGQVVLSGEAEAINYIIENAKNLGIKKAVKLPVSAPFHSVLMEKAASVMDKALSEININMPLFPTIANVSVEQYQSSSEIKENLVKQVYGRVRWRETMQKLVESYGIDTFVEVGPSKVLSTIASKMFEGYKTINLSTPKEIEEYLK